MRAVLKPVLHSGTAACRKAVCVTVGKVAPAKPNRVDSVRPPVLSENRTTASGPAGEGHDAGDRVGHQLQDAFLVPICFTGGPLRDNEAMTQRSLVAAVDFEPEFIAGLIDIFEEKIAFNKLLGLKITCLAPERVTGRIDMKPELVGHYLYNRIHGGVVSATLDAMAGLAVMAAVGARHFHEPIAQRLQRFAKLGTIDLRIDYLRPAIGDHFELRAEVLRLGSRVASTRMEFFGADGKLLSTGAGAYIVS